MSTLQWGFSTLGCPDLHLPEVCALAQEHRLKHLELRTLGGSLDMPAYFAEHFPDMAVARAGLAEHGLRISGLGTSFQLVLEASPAAQAQLLAFARLAEQLEAPYLRVFPGGAWGDDLDQARFDRAAANLAWWREQQAAHGFRAELILETHDSMSSSHLCQRLNEALPEPIGILWDTHHTWRLGGEDPAESWSRLQPWVRHLHVKDSLPQPDGRNQYTYCLPGEGEMPLFPTLQRVIADGYHGTVSLEWEKKWVPYLAPLPEALDAMDRAGWTDL